MKWFSLKTLTAMGGFFLVSCATKAAPPPTMAELEAGDWVRIGSSLEPVVPSATVSPSSQNEPLADAGNAADNSLDETDVEDSATVASLDSESADPFESFLSEGLEEMEEIPADVPEAEGQTAREIILPSDGFFSQHDTELSERLGGLTVFRGFPSEGKTPRHFVPIVYNSVVEKWIAYFVSPKGAPYMERWLAREKRYSPLIRQILQDRGLPEEIIYLAMIESGFNVRAYSTARAVGLWQFIAPTGVRYNMAINWWVDERRDPIRATHAAASYLENLYNEFGSWYLAFAAYNTGEGKIRATKRRSGSDNFWAMRTIRSKRVGLFPETREYVPKYMAAAIIAQAPEKFGFHHLPEVEAFDYDTVTVPGGTSLYLVATAAECDFEDIKRLNPHLLRWFVPPNVASYEIRVPGGKGPGFLARFDELTQSEGLDDFMRYQVAGGDTLLSVAYQFATDPDAISQMNGGIKAVRTGQMLVLPVPRTMEPLELPKNWKHARNLLKRHDAVEPMNAREVGHVVVSRENLRSIASQYGVTTNALKLWNRIGRREGVNAGDVLTIYKSTGDARSVALASTASPYVEVRPLPDDVSNSPVNPIKGMVEEHPLKFSAPASAGGGYTSGDGNYRVRAGDTAIAIARDAGISLTDLRRLNPGVDLNRIYAGQRIQVALLETSSASRPITKPVSASASSPAPDTGLPRLHMVRSGENATTIARRYGLTINQITRLNPGKNLDRLHVGDRLVLRPALPSATSVTAATASRNGIPAGVERLHKVRSGENASAIARRYGVSLTDLRRSNPGVNLDRIRAGQTLVIREGNQQS